MAPLLRLEPGAGGGRRYPGAADGGRPRRGAGLRPPGRWPRTGCFGWPPRRRRCCRAWPGFAAPGMVRAQILAAALLAAAAGFVLRSGRGGSAGQGFFAGLLGGFAVWLTAGGAGRFSLLGFSGLLWRWARPGQARRLGAAILAGARRLHRPASASASAWTRRRAAIWWPPATASRSFSSCWRCCCWSAPRRCSGCHRGGISRSAGGPSASASWRRWCCSGSHCSRTC